MVLPSVLISLPNCLAYLIVCRCFYVPSNCLSYLFVWRCFFHVQLFFTYIYLEDTVYMCVCVCVGGGCVCSCWTFWMTSPKSSSLSVLSNVVFSYCNSTCFEELYKCCPSKTDELIKSTLLNLTFMLLKENLLFTNIAVSITRRNLLWKVSEYILWAMGRIQEMSQVILS